MLPPLPTSRLRQLTFMNCGKCDAALEVAYANLIGGKYLRRRCFNRAVRFVNGSMEKVDALAFDTLQHCESVPLRLLMDFDICRDSALEKVAEARQRLLFNYFVLTGVVEAKVVCERNRKAKKKKTTLDMIGRRLQARICSYLSLADVMDF
ncbi:hypothetical protein HPB52_024284 [Rhipicephalus sanguineus]|uniref:Uncharacterized protein n=1 Tax=Rhipicephalus sanguineus TaxID=34632 RepID=A0A9D4TCM1_RHISA|nr:hypothetical protein HPB52_024284 [Rhipicephalus sanguineus]